MDAGSPQAPLGRADQQSDQEPYPTSPGGMEHVTQVTTNQHIASMGHSDWLWKGPVTYACPIRMKLTTSKK